MANGPGRNEVQGPGLSGVVSEQNRKKAWPGAVEASPVDRGHLGKRAARGEKNPLTHLRANLEGHLRGEGLRGRSVATWGGGEERVEDQREDVLLCATSAITVKCENERSRGSTLTNLEDRGLKRRKTVRAKTPRKSFGKKSDCARKSLNH